MNASPPAAEQYAKKSAAPGLPSEEEIYAALKPWTVTFRSEHRRRTARAILALIRPAFEAKAAKADRLAESVGRLSVQLDAAEAKLAKAVEALDDAAENIEHWGSYASSYLQEKHGWKDDIASARSASAAARAP